jgi:hypothetical protein
MTAIVSSDVLFKLSAPSAVAGNTVAGYAGTSWGGYLSTSVLNSNILLDNLFTDITGPQNAGQQVDYACLFIQNNTGSGNSMSNVVAWMPLSQVTGVGSSIQMGADPTGITAINSNTAQAVSITSSIIAPAGVTTWVVPTNTTPISPSFTNGLQLGTLSPGQCVAVWLKRTALNSVSPSLTAVQIQTMFGTGS